LEKKRPSAKKQREMFHAGGIRNSASYSPQAGDGKKQGKFITGIDLELRDDRKILPPA
jgi:hypothetical protein